MLPHIHRATQKFYIFLIVYLTGCTPSFNIIRGMLADTVPIEDIKYKDTESYFGILYKNNSWKQICRINLDTRKKQLLIPDENKKFIRFYIESLNDLYKYKDKLIEVLNRYLVR